MSTTYIYKIRKDGTPVEYESVKNSWRFGMALWGHLEEKYLPMYRGSYVAAANWYTDDMPDREVAKRLGYAPTRLAAFTHPEAFGEICDLVDSDRLTASERIALGCTFDDVLIHKGVFNKVIEAFRSIPEMQTSAFPEIADILERLLNDDDCIGAGFGISQISNRWEPAYDENDEEVLYNVHKGKEHWWLDDEKPELFHGERKAV